MPSWQCDGKFDKSFSKSFSFFLHLERIIIIFCYWGKWKCKNYISCSIFTIIELYLAMTTSASESHGNMKKVHYYVFFCLDRDESRVNVIYCGLLYYHLVKLLLKLLIYIFSRLYGDVSHSRCNCVVCFRRRLFNRSSMCIKHRCSTFRRKTTAFTPTEPCECVYEPWIRTCSLMWFL